MTELKIDKEFRDKVPPLTPAEFETLEENILKDGKVLSPLIVWNGTIIDGHNRWNIIQKHPEIPYEVKEVDFADRYEAIVWICKNQLGRRNLTDEQKTYLIGKQYEAQKQSQGKHKGNQYTKMESGQNVRFPNPREIKDGVAGKIGEENGMGARTVRRAEKFAKGVDTAEKLSPGFKDEILTGKIKAPKNVIAKIPKMPEPERKTLIGDIRTNGEPNKSTKTCTQCGEEKPLSDFRGKNLVCNKCLYAAKHNGPSIEEVVRDLRNMDRPVNYSSDNLAEELQLITQNLTSQINRALDVRSAVFTEPGAKQKIIAVLSQAETTIKEIKESLL